MKAKFLVALLGGVLVSGSAFAETQPLVDDGSNPDACGAVLCLAGKLREGDCNKYIDDYFDIEKYKNGHFSPSRTKRARGEWLDECKDDTQDKIRANEKWGPVKRGF